MAIFLTTRAISSQLEDIFINSEKFLYIVTPYLQFSPTLYERLSETTKRGIFTSIVCRDKNNLSKNDFKLLMELNCNVYFKKDLHGKCYINETAALISSMNLYNYSEANNRELGVLLTQQDDKIAYEKCVKEINSIIFNSEQERIIAPITLNALLNETTSESDYTWEEFQALWFKHLSNTYPATSFTLDESGISAQSFPQNKIEYTTKYGFATINIDGDWDALKMLKKEKKEYLVQRLKEYRLFWNSPDMICLYYSSDIEFDNISDNIEYCAKGLDLLIQEIRKLTI